jgi:hypothetical protein
MMLGWIHCRRDTEQQRETASRVAEQACRQIVDRMRSIDEAESLEEAQLHAHLMNMSLAFMGGYFGFVVPPHTLDRLQEQWHETYNHAKS